MLKTRITAILCFFLLMIMGAVPSLAVTTSEQKTILWGELSKVDAGELKIGEALTTAVEQGVALDLIVEAALTRNISLVEVVRVASEAGISTSAIRTSLTSAGIDSRVQESALRQASEPDNTLKYSAFLPQDDSPDASSLPGDRPGLAYTPEPSTSPVVSIPAVTANPGGTAQGSSVSRSQL